MLSLFPTLLDWNWYVPFLFRIFLGYYFFNLGLHMMKKSDESAWKILGGMSSIMGIMFVLGVVTQLLGVIAAVSSLMLSYFKKKKMKYSLESTSFYALLSLVSISLLFLGAGPYAIDLPL